MHDSIHFEKYERSGAYHWVQISRHPLQSNAHVKARYIKCVDLVEGALGTLAGKRVADIGCGDGVLSYKLARRGAQVDGVEPDELAVEFARKKHAELGTSATFHAASGYETGLESGAFDAVVCSDVIEHVDRPAALLEEMKRLLRPGGVAVVSTPIRLTSKPLDPMHAVEWFEGEFGPVVEEVFPGAVYDRSHPVFWWEFFNRSQWWRIALNLLSMCWNPFLSGSGWRFYATQYAVAVKEAAS